MAKSTSQFVCQSCGSHFLRWQGQCGECGEWNTLVEEVVVVSKKGRGDSAVAAGSISEEKLVSFSRVEPAKAQKQRVSTGIGELDRVLGGQTAGGMTAGMVPGAVMLIGGEPGIGKSTLLTQVVLNHMELGRVGGSESQKTASAKKKTAKPELSTFQPKVLYVCGEESPEQIVLRINRIRNIEQKNTIAQSGLFSGEAKSESLLFCTETDVDLLVQMITQEKPTLLIIDSIQTIETGELSGAAGSAGQIRESADRITDVAKRYHIPTFLVGHVTKDGVIAGPKVLEHIVDSVLELSGERTSDLRILRAVKNRFGATDEVGVFRVCEWGMEEVTNPSQLFLEQADTAVAGSATVCVIEGTRPLLIEVQALVVSSQLAMPRRVGRGIELSRLQVLAAILQKHCRLPLGSADIFLSAAGGFSIKEPAVDLGLAVAMASSLKERPLPPHTLFIGEVGLLGEVRKVSHLERRIKEAKRLGFKNIISRDSHKQVRDVLSQLGLL